MACGPGRGPDIGLQRGEVSGIVPNIIAKEWNKTPELDFRLLVSGLRQLRRKKNCGLNDANLVFKASALLQLWAILEAVIRMEKKPD